MVQFLQGAFYVLSGLGALFGITGLVRETGNAADDLGSALIKASLAGALGLGAWTAAKRLGVI